MFGTVHEEAKKAVNTWKSSESVDLFVEISRSTILINLRCFLGDEFTAKYGLEFTQCYYTMERYAFHLSFIVLPWAPLPNHRLLRKSFKRMLSLLRENINDRLQNPEKYEHSQDYLQFLLRDYAEYNDQFPQHIFTLIFGAHTNTAGTIGWTIAKLIDNPILYTKVKQEMQTLNMDDLSYDVIRTNLPYLDNCVRETIRLFGPVIIFRQAMDNFYLNRDENGVYTCDSQPKFPTGIRVKPSLHQDQQHYPDSKKSDFQKEEKLPATSFFIPKDRFLMCSPTAMHRDPNIYDQPDEYNPDRWNEKIHDELTASKKFLPFGFGKHRCLGFFYGFLIIKTTLVTLLRNNDVELVGNLATPDWEKAIGTPFSKEPITIRVT